MPGGACYRRLTALSEVEDKHEEDHVAQFARPTASQRTGKAWVFAE
jgi:hypothetical protein